jgi:hypothetical protein
VPRLANESFSKGKFVVANVFNGAGLAKVCPQRGSQGEQKRCPAPFDSSKESISLLSPTWLNISDRKRLLSAGYPTLTELLSTSSLPTNPVARIYPYHDVTLFLLAGLAT